MTITKTLLMSSLADANPASPPSGYSCPIVPDCRPQISSGKFSLGSDSFATGIWVDNTALSGPTVESSIVLNSPVDVGSGINVCPMLLDTSGNGWGLLVGNVAGGYFRLFLFNAWLLTGSAIVTDTTTPIAGATITLRRNTATGAMTAYQNGTQLASITHTSLAYTTTRAACGSRRAAARLTSFSSSYSLPQEITSINGGSPVKPGQTGIPFVLGGYTGFSGVPTAGTVSYYNAAKGSTQTLTLTNISGNASACTADLEDRSEGADYPAYGDTLTITLTRGAETATSTTTLGLKTGETTLIFASAVTTDPTYISKPLADLGYTVNGGQIDYTKPSAPVDMSSLVIYADGSYSCDNEGDFTMWFRPASGLGAGNVYFFTVTLDQDGIVTLVQFVNPVTAIGVVARNITAVAISAR